jgi:cation:H+ antiporter
MLPSKQSSAAIRRGWLQIGVVAAIAAPAPVIRTLELTGIAHAHLPSLAESALFGIAIFAAATLLVWATEVSEQLVSATLALAVLAIIAVLPEYAVDLYFAWTAPANPEHAKFALANMTGANRLLVGFAWPLVFFIYYWLRRRKGEPNEDIAVGNHNAIGLVFLGAASLYNFTIPPRGHLDLIDSGVLMSLFLGYLYLSSRSPPHEEMELVGPAQAIAALPIRLRWAAIVGIFAFAAGTVFSAAEPFASGLVDTGASLGIDRFLLVQWVAPLASESPEFILAGMLALRGRAQSGLTLLLSSEVNQWTLLVGSLPLAYAASDGSFAPLPMDGQQQAEMFLTGASALFAVMVLMSLSFSGREAVLLAGLFLFQLVLPFTEARLAFACVYTLLALIWLVRERADLPRVLRTARQSIAEPSAPVERH